MFNDSGRLYNRAVICGYLTGAAVSFLWAAEAQAHVAWGIVLDQRGQVYFADVLQGGAVWRIDARGRLVRFLIGKHSHGLAIDDNGNLYGEDVSYSRTTDRWMTTLWKATPEGVLIETLTVTDAAPLEDVILFDAAGNHYFWEGNVNAKGTSRIVKLSVVGDRYPLAGSTWGHRDGAGDVAQFRKVGALTWGPEHTLYLTEGGGGAVRRVAMNGAVSTIGGYPLAGIAHGTPEEVTAASLMGIAVDEHGNVFVADNDHGCVRRIAPDGNVSTRARSGFFWKPSGVAVKQGNLYVLEHSIATSDGLGILSVLRVGPYARVRKFSADGDVVTLATIWGANTLVVTAIVAIVGSLCASGIVRRRRRHQDRGEAQ